MSNVIEIPAALTEMQSSLTIKLTTIDHDITILQETRLDTETALAALDRAIRILRGEAEPTVERPAGGRRPMSAEGKENIRKGLLRAAEAKKQAAQTLVTASVAPVVADPTPEPAAAKSGKKAGK